MLSELVNYLVATQAHVEQVEVFCSLRGETGPDGHRGHVTQRAEVKGQRAVVLRVGEGAVAVALRVFLTETQTHELSSCNIVKNLRHHISEWHPVSLPCCSRFQVHRRHTRPGRRCGAPPGACWAGTPGIGWCLCRWRTRRGRERRRSRPAGSSGVSERRPDTPTPHRQWRWSHWWSKPSPCHWRNDASANIQTRDEDGNRCEVCSAAPSSHSKIESSFKCFKVLFLLIFFMLANFLVYMFFCFPRGQN